jgi:hypothetical protein
MYMTRKIENQLIPLLQEQNSARMRAILVKGARRVGKSCTISHVCQQLFGKNFVMLDFQTDLKNISKIFDAPTNDVDQIVQRIQEYKQIRIEKATSVLFFDEVQLDERALNSLRFFSQSGWRVIASGSLLGVTTKGRTLPFPSGVQILQMHPMDFEEWLWVIEDAGAVMAEDIRQHVQTAQPYILHDAAMDLYNKYLVVGGMPAVVKTFASGGSFADVAAAQEEIDQTYTADMTDPENNISGISAKRIWDSLPKQLLRASTKKFKYADVVRGGRRARLLEPLEWLAAAGVCTINNLTRDTAAALAPYQDEEGSYFKVYVADTGVMFHKFGIAADVFLNPATAAALSADFRGALAENFVSQQLAATGKSTFYWMPAHGTPGELDFVYQTPDAQIVAVEVKSGRNVSAKTLTRFMKESAVQVAYKVSANNFSVTFLGEDAAASTTNTDKDNMSTDNEVIKTNPHYVINIPLYAAFAL